MNQRLFAFEAPLPAQLICSFEDESDLTVVRPGGLRAYLERDLNDMRAHGMTSVGLCMGVPVEQATLTDDGVALNLKGSSLHEHLMDLYRDLGFPAPVVQLSDSGQALASEHAFVSKECVRAYTGFWTAMRAECKQRGWPEIIVQPVDEPGWQSQEQKDRNVALLKLLREIPGMRTEQDGPGDAYFHQGVVSLTWAA